MEVRVKYEDGTKFTAEARTHQFNIDQPKEKGGSDSGMKPLEVFLASLGSCIPVYAKKYCKDTNVDTSGLSVEVDAELGPDRPFMLKDIKIKIILNKDLGPRKESLLKFVKNCPIHNTIMGNPNIEITI